MDCTAIRDDVANPMFLFSTHIVQIICSGKGLNCSTNGEDCSAILERWLEMVEESSRPENSIAKRQTVVSTLKLLCNSLFDSSKILGRKIYLWQSLLNVLIDDEPEIKHQAARVVVSMKAFDEPGETVLPIIPSVALDMMIEMFVKVNSFSPCNCVSSLMNWMLSCETEPFDSRGDEQPFDKGELNTYAEDLLLTTVVSKHLSRYLCSQPMDKQILVSVDKIFCWKILKEENKDQLDINVVITQCLTEANSVIERIHVRRAISPFLDGYFDHDLLQIYQRVQVILAVVPWTKSYKGFKEQGLKLVSEIQSLNWRTYFIEDLISQIHICLQNVTD